MVYITALILFGLLSIVLLFVEIQFTYLTQGFSFGFSSNRSATAEFSPFARRIKNTYQNQVEAAAYSVPILAAAALSGLESSSAEIAAYAFVLGRLAFAVLYYTGVPLARVPAFAVAVVSIVYIAYSLLASGLA